MDSPISLALVLASSTSVYEGFTGRHQAYFDAALMLTLFLRGAATSTT